MTSTVFRTTARLYSTMLALALIATSPLDAGAPQRVSTGDGQLSRRQMVDTYCSTCHNDRRKVAGLSFDGLDAEHLAANPETWEKVARKLRLGAMPPPGMPRPAASASRALIASIEEALDGAAAASPNPGRPGLHRLNRSEYANAIRDLLALDIDGRALLPADDTGYGFDNIGDVLTVSPALLERYLMAAQKISRLAVGDAALDATVAVYAVPYLTLLQHERMGDDLPFGTRGGVAIRHYFPLDGEYEIRIRLQRNALDLGAEIRGLDVMNAIDLRLDGERMHVFSLGGRQYGAGSYSAGDDQGDSRLALCLPIRAGGHVVGVTFENQTWDVEGLGMSRLPPASHGYAAGRGTEQNFGRIQMGVDRIEIAGPFRAMSPEQTPSRTRIFVCRPATSASERGCANRIIRTLARRAYRRAVTAIDIDRLMPFYEAGRRKGSFDTGIQWALERILISPSFLVRNEQDPPGGSVHRISDVELASRLSFFLWSSIPDDELLDLATHGRLHQPAILEQQVRRMIADRRASALVSNFLGQWLLVRNIRDLQRDVRIFPEFDENLHAGFLQETQLFLDAQLREDRPATELLTANYTFVNERLAQHYGIPHVYGSHFRRVSYPDDARAGLLGHGSILTVTSYADRTSVVLRGKWILENVLGTPPPAPPADVPPLDSTKVDGTLRQRMERHRSNPVCATCHAQIDPLGFALENFNAIGQWRTHDGGNVIDPSGVMVDGSTFSRPADFRKAVLSHQDAFIITLTEKLLTYALGRGVEFYDMPAVRAVVRGAAARDFRWSAIIEGIVKSVPFQMRRAES